MKALTICQPYAHLIVRGEKRVENREWPTRYRGPLVIHAGKSREWLHPEDLTQYAAEGDPIVFGAAVGIATLADCLHIDRIRRGDHDSRYPWLRQHHHTEGTWCWVLADVRRVAPVPYSGAQGLWDFPERMLPVHPQLRAEATLGTKMTRQEQPYHLPPVLDLDPHMNARINEALTATAFPLADYCAFAVAWPYTGEQCKELHSWLHRNGLTPNASLTCLQAGA